MKNLFFALIFLGSLFAKAQNRTVSGYIEDAASQERLIGVNVFLKGTDFGTSTNTYGFYSLTVPQGDYELIVSYIGYATVRDSIVLETNLQRDFQIKELTQELQEVAVYADEIIAESPQMSTIRLSIPDIKKIPAFLGEVDIIRAIQLLPGVQSGSEGTTGFYVRGGSPDQNLILLDGVPVYNASHLFGFFSVFNADAIKNVQLTKGGFPARFGGRLSSVLEIDMKEGNMKEFHGSGSIGLISSKLALEGPIVKDKTSFILSGRRTYADLVAQPFLPEGQKSGYFFHDVNAKVNHIISRKDRLYLSYYGGLDKLYYRESYNDGGFGGRPSYEEETRGKLQWGNHTGSLRWNHLFSDKLFGNLTATYTQYRFLTGFENRYGERGGPTEVEGFEYSSLIRDQGLRYDLEYSLNTAHSLRSGVSYTRHRFEPGAAQFIGELADALDQSLINLSEPITAHDIFAYIEDDWRISDRWRANYGLHYSIYNADGMTYNNLQPRVSARYLLKDDWSLKGSYAMMNQYVHLLANSGLGLPTDLWVSSTERVKPQLSHQVAVGSTKNIQGKMYEFTIEGYYKWMENLIAYKEGSSFITPTDWQNNVETDGQGRTYGAEFLVRKNEGKTTGWIGYTLAWSNRQFSNINNGEQFPYKYDRRHDVSIVVNHQFSKKFDLGATWVYGSGNTYTAPLARFYLSDPFGGAQIYQQFTERNSLRMPAYHRFDIGFNWHKDTKWGQRTWNVSVYNAYNRQNPFFIYIDEKNNGEKEVKQVSLFPVIPSISYIFSF